jgi:hypothetical protein
VSREAYKPSGVVNRGRFPKLAAFVEWGIDMQLGDVRDLLRLPMPEAGLDSGHNFSSAAVLVNLIGGASVWFYDASEEGLRNRTDRSRRYRETLERYWPWEGELIEPQDVVQVLYAHARNPLAHSFGMPDPAEAKLISIRKSPLTEGQIGELDTATGRPGWVGPTITAGRVGSPGHSYELSVPALYWAVQRLLRMLLTDEDQAQRADDLAEILIRFLTAPNAAWRTGRRST